MTITILHNAICNIWETTKETIETILKENGLTTTIEEIVITNDSEAKEYHFSGSPQILIDGIDIDPMASKITNYHESGCRLYMWKGVLHEGPSKEMLVEAIKKEKRNL